MESFSNPTKILPFPEGEGQRRSAGGNGSVDLGRYIDDLKSAGVSREHSEELLRVLWTIITAFVDLGYGVHPTQRAMPSNHQTTAIAATIHEFVKSAA